MGSDGERPCRQPGREEGAGQSLRVLAVGARRGAALVENLTHASKPSLCPGASSCWSSCALGQLQPQNACGHESR